MDDSHSGSMGTLSLYFRYIYFNPNIIINCTIFIYSLIKCSSNSLSCPVVKIYCEILNNRCEELFIIRCCKDPKMSMGKYPEPSTLWNSQTLPSVCCLALQILNSTAAHCFQKDLLNKKIFGCQGFNGLPPQEHFYLQ